jgi:hypothetical protein
MKTIEDQDEVHKAPVRPFSEEWAEAWKQLKERVRRRPALHILIAIALGYSLQIIPLRSILVLVFWFSVNWKKRPWLLTNQGRCCSVSC